MTSSPKRKHKRRGTTKISSPKRRHSRKRISKKRVSKKRSKSPVSWKPGRLRRKQFRVPKNNIKRIKSIFLVRTPNLRRSAISRPAEEARHVSPVVTRAATRAPSVNKYRTPSQQIIRAKNVETPPHRAPFMKNVLSPQRPRSPRKLSTIRSVDTVANEN